MNLTTKELSGIEDILSHYTNSIKKAEYYKSISNDKAIKKMCDELYKKNVKDFNDLLNFIRG